MKKIKFSKDLEFLRPFVESVSKLVDLSNIKAIKSFKVRKHLKSLTYGATTTKDDKTYTITLRTYLWSVDKNKYISETFSIVLDTLAHELAHTKHWEHNYKHFQIQTLILLRFSKVIKKLGIKDTSARFNNLNTTIKHRRK